MIRTATKIAALTVVLSLTGLASANPVAWDSPGGTNPTYSYSSGQTLNGAFGNGYGLPNGFAFFPTNLKAEGSNNGSGSIGDTASVILQAKPNHVFTTITAQLVGDFSILGTGNVNSTSQLRVENLETSEIAWATLTYTPVMPVSTQFSADGEFEALANIALPAGWDNVKLALDGQVSAFGDSGSTSFIEIKTGSIGVQTAVIPLPAAVLAAPVALGIAYRARRKMLRK